jgi:imidazolonepropionase-like amidohydrolase
MRFFLILLLCSVVGRCAAQDLVIEDAKVYISPEAPPLTGTTVVVRSGKIVELANHPVNVKGATVLPCKGCVVCAGFWNTHVHFTEPKWQDAAHAPAARLTEQMQAMLTQSGFTSIVDTGSDPQNTVTLRRRVESGEVLGPRIYTAGWPLFPPHALPFYLADLPPQARAQLGQPEDEAQVDALIERNLALGSDVVKLFTGSYVERGKVVPMSLILARRAVEDAHSHEQIVFAHPSSAEGIRVAIESGVDVLAHAPDTVNGVDDALLRKAVEHHMTMVPTLKLFSDTNNIVEIRAIVKSFHAMGGELMFGTDTGFLTDYDVGEEYRQLCRVGLSYRDVLAMLTTVPSRRLGVSAHEGAVAKGMDGDLTVLSADPALGDPAAFTQVMYTIRGGRVIYRHADQ